MFDFVLFTNLYNVKNMINKLKNLHEFTGNIWIFGGFIYEQLTYEYQKSTNTQF